MWRERDFEMLAQKQDSKFVVKKNIWGKFSVSLKKYPSVQKELQLAQLPTMHQSAS